MSDSGTTSAQGLQPAGVALITHSDVLRTSVTRMCADSASRIRLLPGRQVHRADVVLFDAGALVEGADGLREVLATDTPVIVLTRDPHPELTRLAVDLGARHFLPTAATMRRLVDTVEAVVQARPISPGAGPRRRHSSVNS